MISHMSKKITRQDVKRMMFEEGYSDEENNLFLNILFKESPHERIVSAYVDDEVSRVDDKQDTEDKNEYVIDFLLQVPRADGIRYNQLTPFFDPPDIPTPKKEDNLVRHNINLHHYTKLGARQVMQRILLDLNPEKKHTLKIDVGKGKHSQNNVPVIPGVVESVFEDLQFPKPGVHAKNPGYLATTIDMKKYIDQS